MPWRYGAIYMRDWCVAYKPVEPEIRENPRVQALYQAFLCCTNEEMLSRFLRDLWGEREHRLFANRLAAARLLLEGKPQAQVAKDLGMSTNTVNDVAKWVTGIEARGGFADVCRCLPQRSDDGPAG